jgi:hypothetical protein
VYADAKLIDDARRSSRKASMSRREYIDGRIAFYRTACDLSRGGDPLRSAYWAAEALSVRRELLAIAGRTVKEEALR